ncbi:MAG: TIGR00366 family protein [Polyangia bacterium]
MQTVQTSSWLVRLGLRLVALLERYLPDAFVFALIATALVFLLGLGWTRTAPGALVDGWGKGFFSLLPFTLQMALIIIGGHVVASAPSVAAGLRALARVPRTARGAVAWVTLLALVSSWFNWGFSLIFSALLAKELARQLARRGVAVDYRALAAASFLGLGSIWAQGLSGSAALQMATPGSLPAALLPIIEGTGATGAATWARWGRGVIPLSHTIFLWQSLASVAVELVVVTLLMWRAAPTGEQAVTAAQLGIALDEPGAPAGETTEVQAGRQAGARPQPLSRPGERLERSPWLSGLFVLAGAAYLGRYLYSAPSVLEAINLNTINLALLVLGAALHRTPARLMHAFAQATPTVWGVILQFPFYGGIAGMLSVSALNERIAGVFVSASTRATLPPLVALYSAVLGVFVPSGGSKWLIEAPYVLGAAHRLKVHLGWMVAVYDLGEALANLVQPFWMLPVLALLGLRARDVMGYTFLVFLVLLPLVLALTLVLGLTLPYPL